MVGMGLPGPDRWRQRRERARVEQAAGILMERHGIPAAEAHALLTEMCQRSGVELQVVAEQIVLLATTRPRS
jgi:AmiR/NasT family two-component response regulator